VLLDTFDKAGEGLSALAATPTLARWVADAHDAGLIAAVAGKLSAGDIPLMRAIGADIAGVRGAACKGGRTGVVVAENVRMLRGLCVGDGRATACSLPYHLLRPRKPACRPPW
jgi:(5-formylfuran-3-yl)methyl phosphate synthase